MKRYKVTLRAEDTMHIMAENAAEAEVTAHRELLRYNASPSTRFMVASVKEAPQLASGFYWLYCKDSGVRSVGRLSNRWEILGNSRVFTTDRVLAEFTVGDYIGPLQEAK